MGNDRTAKRTFILAGAGILFLWVGVFYPDAPYPAVVLSWSLAALCFCGSVIGAVKWILSDIARQFKEIQEARAITPTSLALDKARGVQSEVAVEAMRRPGRLQLTVVPSLQGPYIYVGDLEAGGLAPLQDSVDFLSGSMFQFPELLRVRKQGADIRPYMSNLIKQLAALGYVRVFSGNQPARWLCTEAEASWLLMQLQKLAELQLELWESQEEVRVDLNQELQPQ